jgi:hypothetical protein
MQQQAEFMRLVQGGNSKSSGLMEHFAGGKLADMLERLSPLSTSEGRSVPEKLPAVGQWQECYADGPAA